MAVEVVPDELGVTTVPSCATQGVVVPGAVVPGKVLGGFEAVPGWWTWVPPPLLTGTQGAKWLPGIVGAEVCASANELMPRAQLSKKVDLNNFVFIRVSATDVRRVYGGVRRGGIQ